MKHHNISSHLGFSFFGPSLSAGPLPALFYFALSAQDSLALDPFNQPVTYLKHLTHTSLRIFSVTIPGHENHLPKEKALETWAHAIKQGKDPITPFIQAIGHILDYLFEQHALVKEKIALAGLSRGGYIATLAAARYPCCKIVLGFSPMIRLDRAKEFADIQNSPLVDALSLVHTLPHLTQTQIKYYIGNRDTRVGTKAVFEWISSLAQLAHDTRAKNGSFQLMMHDSVGLMGHGTPPHIFEEGAQWIQNMLSLH